MPVARQSERAPAALRPWVVTRERRAGITRLPSSGARRTPRRAEADRGHAQTGAVARRRRSAPRRTPPLSRRCSERISDHGTRREPTSRRTVSASVSTVVRTRSTHTTTATGSRYTSQSQGAPNATGVAQTASSTAPRIVSGGMRNTARSLTPPSSQSQACAGLAAATGRLGACRVVRPPRRMSASPTARGWGRASARSSGRGRASPPRSARCGRSPTRSGGAAARSATSGRRRAPAPLPLGDRPARGWARSPFGTTRPGATPRRAGYGTGMALIVDEFALLLDLKDVYWERQGRVSVDLGVGLVAAGGTTFSAIPLLRRLNRNRTRYGSHDADVTSHGFDAPPPGRLASPPCRRPRSSYFPGASTPERALGRRRATLVPPIRRSGVFSCSDPVSEQ